MNTVAIDLLLLAVVLIDRRATGRVHPVWLLGGAALISVQYLRIAVVPTAFWRGVTQCLARFIREAGRRRQDRRHGAELSALDNVLAKQ